MNTTLSINLLPKEHKTKRRTKRIISLLTTLTLVLLAMVIIILIGLYILDLTVSSTTTETAQQIDQMTTKINNYQQVEKKAIYIADRLKAYESLKNSRVKWSETIVQLANITPSDIQITSLSVNLDAPPHFRLAGLAATNREIVKYQAKIVDSPYFGEAKLESTTAAMTSSGKDGFSFNLSFNYKGKK
jgi:Tfp pilus assembly protein PilN